MSKGPQPYTIHESDTPIVKALKRICNRKHMSQVQLAVELKVGLKKVNNMINHNDYPDYEQMVILIKEFGVTASDLFGPELSLKLHDNAEKYLASKKPTSVGQTPEKYVDVTLACTKNPEPVPEPVPEQVKKRRCDTRKEGFVSKLAMLFNATK